MGAWRYKRTQVGQGGRGQVAAVAGVGQVQWGVEEPTSLPAKAGRH